MVRNPVIGSIDSMLLSFNAKNQMFVADIPQMAGKSFGELYKWSAYLFLCYYLLCYCLVLPGT